MKNKLSLFLCLMMLNGCYKTSPTEWNTSKGRDIIKSKEKIRNGSRLDLMTDINQGSLQITAINVPRCRFAENGYSIIKERGLENSYGWPGAVTGVAMIGGGIGMMGYGFSGKEDKSSEESATRLLAALGGVGTMALGGALFGKCVALNGCGPDPKIEEREHDGPPFRRWNDDEREDCSGLRPESAGIVPLTIVANFASTKQTLEWTPITDNSGVVTLRIADIIKNVSAHCGEATVTIFSRAEKATIPDDSPASPSQSRDTSVVKEFKIEPARVSSPSVIKDNVAWKVANDCATEKRSTCTDPKVRTVAEQCIRDCNSEQGAEECQINFESQNVSGLSSDEKSILEAKYKTCVASSAVDTSKVKTCKDACVERTFDKLCPRGW